MIKQFPTKKEMVDHLFSWFLEVLGLPGYSNICFTRGNPGFCQILHEENLNFDLDVVEIYYQVISFPSRIPGAGISTYMDGCFFFLGNLGKNTPVPWTAWVLQNQHDVGSGIVGCARCTYNRGHPRLNQWCNEW